MKENSVSDSHSHDKPYLGEWLRKLRRQSGRRQEDLAQELGVDRSTISNLERHRNLPTPEHLEHLSSIFGIPIDELRSSPIHPKILMYRATSAPSVGGSSPEDIISVSRSELRTLLVEAAAEGARIALKQQVHPPIPEAPDT
jgi:transcriptional regulator with XRE-family HTH domain